MVAYQVALFLVFWRNIMTVINLTPHSVEVYAENQFVNLEQINPTTWVADSVEGEPIASYESQGVARISVSTQVLPSELPGETVTTSYGEATGIPENVEEGNGNVLIISLPMKSMAVAANHPLASQMVSPYKVVRSRENGSLVLGCMGFTY
jgi:hypothetical protein